jgi:hypothetical protein
MGKGNMPRTPGCRSGCGLPALVGAAALLSVFSTLVMLVAVGKAPVSIRVELAGPGPVAEQGNLQPLPSPTAAGPSRARGLQAVPARLPDNATARTAKQLDSSGGGGSPSSTAGVSSDQPVGRRNLPPILLVSTGCGQSTIQIKLLRILVEAAGYPVYNQHDEAFRFRPGHSVDVHWLLNDANQRGLTLVHKLWQQDSPPEKDIERLIADGARAIVLLRGNMLDRLVCLVRDCWMGKEIGASVDNEGNESDLCYSRRSCEQDLYRSRNVLLRTEGTREQNRTKGRLNTDGLLERIQGLNAGVKRLRKWTRGLWA